MSGFSERMSPGVPAEAPRMSMAERYEQKRMQQEAPKLAPVEDPAAAEARMLRIQAAEQKQVTARGQASKLIDDLRSRRDIPNVPGGGEVISFAATRDAANARVQSRVISEQYVAQDARMQTSELSRQQDERLAAEAYRMAMAEKMTLERQQYDTRHFDMQGAIRRNTEKLKREAAQRDAKKEGKFAM